MSAWHITLKDLRLLAHDKRALVLLLILPLMFISIVGMSTGQFLTRDDDAEQFKIVVVDQNHTETSADLVKEMRERPELSLKSADSVESGFDVLRRGDASMMMIIGPEFATRVDDIRISDIFNEQKGLAATGPAGLDLSFESKLNASGVGRLLEAVLFSQVIKFVAPIAASKNPVTRAWVRPRDADETADVAASSAPTSAEVRVRTNSVYLWVVPGFTVMFAFFLISVMARSFIIERDQGTLRRLLMAPVNTLSVLLGKTAPFYLTSVVQCALLFLCGRMLFGMPWGSHPLYLIPVILCTSAAATSLGLLLATMVQTDQQVSSYGTTLILVLSSVSGCFFPRELFPKMMKQISLFTPHAWSLKAFDAVLTQPQVDPRMIATCCGMLLVFAVTCFTVGWWRFRATAQV